MLKRSILLALPFLSISTAVYSAEMTLFSQDIQHGKHMSKAQEFNGFGCVGKDLSPQLQWAGAPENTKSFAVTAYDPDAPTGSGWWHWQIINIPKNITSLAEGAGSGDLALAPTGSHQIENDYGKRGFGGACPPKGHGLHRYRFTVHALSVEKLEVPENASGALVGYMINGNTIDSVTLEALYQREY